MTEWKTPEERQAIFSYQRTRGLPHLVKAVGAGVIAAVASFIAYLVVLVLLSLTRDFFQNRAMFEAHLFVGAFIKPVGLVFIAGWIWLFGRFLSRPGPQAWGRRIIYLYLVVAVLPYFLSFAFTPEPDVAEEGGPDRKELLNEEIAAPPKWNEIVADERFEQLSEEKQEVVRQEYFQRYVVPSIPDGHDIEEYRREWDRLTKSSLRRTDNK